MNVFSFFFRRLYIYMYSVALSSDLHPNSRIVFFEQCLYTEVPSDFSPCNLYNPIKESPRSGVTKVKRFLSPCRLRFRFRRCRPCVNPDVDYELRFQIYISDDHHNYSLYQQVPSCSLRGIQQQMDHVGLGFVLYNNFRVLGFVRRHGRQTTGC